MTDTKDQDQPPTDEETRRRAGELARLVMSMPYRKQEWPKKAPRPVKKDDKPAE